MSNSLWPHGLCSPPGFSIHGILQARILEWIAIPFSRGTSQPRDRTLVSCIAGRFFTVWANVTLSRWPQYGTQHSQTHSRSLLPPGQSWYDLGMCLQGSESAGRHSALILEVRWSGKTWWSHVLEATQFLTDRGLKTHSVDAYASLKEPSFPSILCAESHTLLENACSEVVFQ